MAAKEMAVPRPAEARAAVVAMVEIGQTEAADGTAKAAAEAVMAEASTVARQVPAARVQVEAPA